LPTASIIGQLWKGVRLKKNSPSIISENPIAVGSVVNLLIHPVGAITIGTLAGALSVVGYRYLSVKLFPIIFTLPCLCNLLQLI
jgi:hypothetical protein